MLKSKSESTTSFPNTAARIAVRCSVVFALFGLLGVGGAAACRSRTGDPGSSGSTSSSSSSSSSGGELDAGTFDKRALLQAFGDCALSDYRAFAASAAALDTATAAATPSASASRDAAQAAWKSAMDVWERLEVLQFGPTASSSSPGGRDLRDPIYAWPLVGRCIVEQTIMQKAYEAPGWASTSLVNTRSLAAAEYLLFYSGFDNACPPQSDINASGSWAALGADEIAARRLAYARVVTNDIAVRAAALLDAWDPTKGNFALELANAGQQSKTFGTQQLAFNAVSDAMFYIDLQVKNVKVGKPAGLVVGDCTNPPCLSSVESPFAKRSKDHIRANLAGYEKMLHGCGPNGTGLGFDDLLVAIGATEVAKKLDDTLAQVYFAVDQLTEPTFEEDLQKNPVGVKRLFDALRANSTAMKADFVTVLDLGLPKLVEGDND